MFPVEGLEVALRETWNTFAQLSVAPLVVLAIGALVYLMVRMGWRKVETRSVKCPETGRPERALLDLSHEPEGFRDVLRCSRFGRGNVTCGKECVARPR